MFPLKSWEWTEKFVSELHREPSFRVPSRAYSLLCINKTPPKEARTNYERILTEVRIECEARAKVLQGLGIPPLLIGEMTTNLEEAQDVQFWMRVRELGISAFNFMAMLSNTQSYVRVKVWKFLQQSSLKRIHWALWRTRGYVMRISVILLLQMYGRAQLIYKRRKMWRSVRSHGQVRV